MTDQQLQVQKNEPTPIQLFNRTLTSDRMQEYLSRVLGEKKDSFVANITALVNNDQKLQVCEPTTLIYAAINATALDLPLNANFGFAYVIPYNNKKTQKTEAQFQLGYRGFIQLALRTGLFRSINVRDVREGEITGEDFISGEYQFRKLPDDVRINAPIIGHVAYFELLSGFRKMFYMSIPEIEQHARRYSQTYGSNRDYIRESSKWTTDFDAMAQKTVLKLLLSKYAPLSSEMRKAIESDQSVLDESGNPAYVDNQVDEQWANQEKESAVEQKKAALRAKREAEEAQRQVDLQDLPQVDADPEPNGTIPEFK